MVVTHLRVPCIMPCLKVWDRRHGDHALKTIQCHSGPAYCCNWHPVTENIVLTAGRDKTIKVRQDSDILYVRSSAVF